MPISMPTQAQRANPFPESPVLDANAPLEYLINQAKETSLMVLEESERLRAYVTRETNTSPGQSQPDFSCGLGKNEVYAIVVTLQAIRENIHRVGNHLCSF